MIYLFEFDPPCSLRPKVERIGRMTRIIWMWWSVAFIRAGINDMLCGLMQEGWDRAKDGEQRPEYKNPRRWQSE
jgi:hypothetical protein